MAIVDENQARGGRILTYENIKSDEQSINVAVDDGKIRLSSNVRSLDDFTEVSTDVTRKLDYWEDFPDISEADTAVKYYNEDRTIVFTGTSNGLLRRGCYYKCSPDAEYSWVEPTYYDKSDIVRFDETIKGFTISFTNEDDYRIVLRDRTTNVVKAILYPTIESNTKYIKLAVGETIESGTIYTAYVYSDTTAAWGRHTDITQYMAFNNTIISDIESSGLEEGLSKFIRVHKSAEGLNTLPFDWKKITQPAIIPMYPYDTVKPNSNNVCFLNPTSSCFFFGLLPAESSIINIVLDISNLTPSKFYGNNVITFDTSNAKAMTFTALYNNAARTVNVVGSVKHAGKYKALIEIVPDDTVTVIITQLDASTSEETEEMGYCYGFRYNLDDSSPAIIRIELRRYTDAAGNIVETISQVPAFSQMPCHDFHRCLMDVDGNVSRLYNSTSLYMNDGKTFANLTGEKGDVVVEIPKTYLRVTVPADQEYAYSNTTLSYITEANKGEKAGVPICDDARYEYNGYIDYLVSTKPIPDPPKNASGNYTTVKRVIFNGVHPLFRIGGEYELDSAGNYQYETRYNYDTDQFESTDILLRKAADACYAAAFASVRCYHSETNGTTATLRVDATSAADDQKITPSGYFSDGANYPKQTCGLAMGGQQNGDADKMEARSIAPYKDGDMVGIATPGVMVNISTDDITKPDLMPGGCSTIFPATKATSDDATKASTNNVYEKSLTFMQPDGSIVTKDYKIYWDSTTTKWILTDGNKTLANSGTCAASEDVDFANITWDVIDGGATALERVNMSTANKGTKIYIGPTNYGTRDATFDWNTVRSSWDNAMCYNPNWALNYRPAVSISRAVFQSCHGNKARRVDDGSDPTVQTWQTEFGGNWVAIESLIDGTPYLKFNNNPSVKLVFGKFTGCDDNETIVEDRTYYMKTAADSYSQTYYRMVPTPAKLTKSYYKVLLCPTTESPFLPGNNAAAYTWIEWDKDSTIDSNTYCNKKEYYCIEYRGGVKCWTIVKHTSTLSSDKTYYLDTELAVTNNDINAGSQSHTSNYPTTNVWEARFKDTYNRYLEFYDCGYFPRNSFGPVTGTFNNETSIGMELGKFTCSDTQTVDTLRTWYFTDSSGTQYKLEFDHPSLRWKVYKRTDTWVAIYQSEPQDCCVAYWNTLGLYNNYMERRIFTTNTTTSACSTSTKYSSTVTLPFIGDDPAASAATYTAFTFQDPALVPAVGIVSAYRKYYTRTGSGTTSDPYVYTQDTTVVAGNALTSDHYCMVFTHDVGNKIDPSVGTASTNTVYYTKTNTSGSDTFQVKTFSSVTRNGSTVRQVHDYWIEDLNDGDKIYTRSDYTNRTWLNGSMTSGTAYRIEYITSDDNRKVGSGNPVNFDYGDCWVVAKYVDGVLTSIVASDMDINVYSGTSIGAAAAGVLFRPLNSYTRNTQRTYDSSTGNTTNTSVIYDAKACPTTTVNNVVTTHPYGVATTGEAILMFFIDENGHYPSYLNHILNEESIGKLQTAVGGKTNCWVIVYSASGTVASGISARTNWVLKAYSRAAFVNVQQQNVIGPQAVWQQFMAVPGSTDADGAPLMDNNRVLKFKPVNVAYVRRANARAYNCHTRLKQYMALMMVIDGGTFDTQSGISTGKSWLASFDYARSTFSGRTATMGNISGEIAYDSAVDININSDSDWSATARQDQTKKVVAFNWRGFENPFGNIGEYEDGIIPCTRFIDGHEVTGYYECIDPGAYSDTMLLINTYKNMPMYNGARQLVFSEYAPSAAYTWRIHAFPASGWIKRWDPVTFLPTRAPGGSSTTYCCGHLYVYWKLCPGMRTGDYRPICLFQNKESNNLGFFNLSVETFPYGSGRPPGTRLQF